MGVKTEYFGTTVNGEVIHSYTLDNGEINARVIDFGAILVNLCVPDRYGIRDDIVLGFDRLDQYETNKDFFGATVGIVCNRTADAQMPIEGTVYNMKVNDGPNNLHTDHDHGLHKKIWKALTGEDFVTFMLELDDGEYGLPGNRNITVTYSLTVDNGLRIHYHGTSDRLTPFNMTNHSYFNLEGHDAGYIGDTLLTINASAYTPCREGAIPTGEIRNVEGTAFDFRTGKPIGKDIDSDDKQLKAAGGYDHNYVIDGYDAEGGFCEAATAYSKKSGRVMKVTTTLPGVQFYTGNWVDDKDGKNRHDYARRQAFCLETQYFPDTIHHDNFPGYLVGGKTVYDAQTKFIFSVD